MNYSNGVTGDGKQENTTKEQAEIREKLYGNRSSILGIPDDCPILKSRDLFDKMEEVRDNIDQVHTSLAKSNCPTDVYNLLSPVMIQAKADILQIHYSVSDLTDDRDACQETLEDFRREIETLTKKIEDYKYVCKVDKIPPLIIDHPEFLSSIKITPFSQLTGDDRKWAEDAIKEYESGENKIVSREDEIATLNNIIELKERERKEWADLCIRKQTFIESMFENATLGNVDEVMNVLKKAISERDKSNTKPSENEKV